MRLVEARNQWPDFEIRTRGHKVEPWEFTEADDPRRHRGREMRRMETRRAAGKSPTKSVPFDRLIKQGARVPGWIRARCRAKVARHYSGRAGLLGKMGSGLQNCIKMFSQSIGGFAGTMRKLLKVGNQMA